MADVSKIKKIKLSDGSVYAIFDEGSLRLNDQRILVTGNSVVDEVIVNGRLKIIEIDDIPIEKSIDKVLTWDSATGSLYTCTLQELFKDLYGLDVTNHVLILNNSYSE